MPAQSSGAASAESSASGMEIAKRLSARMLRAKPPKPARQVGREPEQRFCKPCRHHSQSLQLPRCQPTPTRCPGATVATPAPTAVTVPTASWPGTRGYAETPKSLSTRCTSVWHTPQWVTAISTSPGSNEPGLYDHGCKWACGDIAA